MTPERWSLIREVFAAAMETPDAERPRFLESACAGDAELRAEVERLLAGSEEPSWQSPAAELVAAAAELAPGDTVAHYRIEAKLGEGGMGVVYKASDSRLRRSVALKFVKAQFSSRNQREARAVAALNHPNICTLYDVGPNYLVMELIEGPTLAQRLAKGAIPLAETLSIARQTAEALEAAHEKGVVHRDLKPANIKLTSDGAVKVLDFGLAKAQELTAGSAEASHTQSFSVTQPGMILGTAAYMSPEQASGKPVDRRADIWSFGVVLWEMLTARRLFGGETTSHTLAEVLHRPIEFDQLPRETPAAIRGLLRRCLDRNVKNRLRDIGEARIAIESALAGEGPPLESTPESVGARRQWLGWGVAAALAVGLAPIAFLHFREEPPAPAAPVRFQIPGPGNTNVNFYASPDGRKLGFALKGRIWVHFRESGESRDLAAQDNGGLFWSADSRYIGYPNQGKIRRIEATGGSPQTVTDFRGAWGGGTWNQDDVIVFSDRRAGLFRVPAAGGVPIQITAVDSARRESHICPAFLPDDRHFAYLRVRPGEGTSAIYIGSVDAKPAQQSLKPLVTSNSQPVYTPSKDPDTGYLLFVREDTLVAQPFDNRRLQLKGEAAPVAEKAGVFGRRGAVAAFSASANVLTFPRSSWADFRLAWFDREGKALGNVGEPGAYGYPVLSPDGARVAVTKVTGAYTGNIWLLDLSRGGTSTRFTFGSLGDDDPIWSPDGSRIVFSSNRDGPSNLYQKPVSGAEDEKVLLNSSEDKFATSWSRDGRFLLYTVIHPKTKADIWLLPLEGDRNPVPFLITEFNEAHAQFCPGGHWVAYVSDESGEDRVYVRSFSTNSTGTPVETGGKWQISDGYGIYPRWRSDGRELYYFSSDRRVMAVETAPDQTFRAGPPQPLGASVSAFGWDASADGKRFLSLPNTGFPQPFTVVLNWQSGLK